MSATSEISMGISDGRPSSRVLKPPGGGHSNIFAAPEAEVPKPRAKYNQQNSSNLNSCMNTVDPNEAVAKIVNDKIVSPTTAAVPSFKPVINNITPIIPAKTNGAIQNGNGVGAANHAPPISAPVVQKAPVPVAEKASTPVLEKPSTLPIAAAAAPAPTSSSPPQSGGRVRQPPGGYSSGLW